MRSNGKSWGRNVCRGRKPEGGCPPPMDQKPTPQLFREAFGRDAQRQRLAEREAHQKELEQQADLNRRRQHFAAMRAAQGSTDEAQG